MPIDNIHDKFFKESFSRKHLVEGLIEELFPKKLSQNIDLASLKFSNSSFTDEKLEEHFADIVYDCTYKSNQKLRISLLFEHKFIRKNTHIFSCCGICSMRGSKILKKNGGWRLLFLSSFIMAKVIGNTSLWSNILRV